MPKFPPAPSTIELRYSQLEDLIAWQLDVHPKRRKTLGARMRLFRTRGFPADVIAVTKTQFAYDLNTVLQMALAYALMDAFIPQETAPVIIQRDWKQLRAAFVDAYALIRDKGDAEAAKDHDRPVLLVTPRNLYAFSLDVSEQGEPADTVRLKVSTAILASDGIRDGGARGRHCRRDRH